MTTQTNTVLEPPVDSKPVTEEKVRAIFLDCDGVVCTARSHLAYGREGTTWFEWDELACEVLRNTCRRGVRIVVSSTWRHPKHRPQLEMQLARHRLDMYLHQPDWFTKDLNVSRTGGWEGYQGYKIRGTEIQEYLDRHPEIVDYRIIDDVMQFLPCQEKKVIHTNFDEGMTTENIRDLLRWCGYLKS